MSARVSNLLKAGLGYDWNSSLHRLSVTREVGKSNWLFQSLEKFLLNQLLCHNLRLSSFWRRFGPKFGLVIRAFSLFSSECHSPPDVENPCFKPGGEYEDGWTESESHILIMTLSIS